MKRASKLSTAQNELLEAMRSGVRVHYLRGMNSHAFRADTMKSCTATVMALHRMGLVEEYKKDWRGCIYRPVVERVTP